MEFISKRCVSKIKHCKANLYLWQFMTNTKWRRLNLTFYHRGITVGVAPDPRGNRVRRDPGPAVLPSMWSPNTAVMEEQTGLERTARKHKACDAA